MASSRRLCRVLLHPLRGSPLPEGALCCHSDSHNKSKFTAPIRRGDLRSPANKRLAIARAGEHCSPLRDFYVVLNTPINQNLPYPYAPLFPPLPHSLTPLYARPSGNIPSSLFPLHSSLFTLTFSSSLPHPKKIKKSEIGS